MKARCLICEGEEWENVDEYFPKKMGAHICKSCGFVTYDSILKTEEMKEFYREEYRPAPTINNEYTTERKIHYHNAFLDEVFKKWKDNNKSPSVYESGAAYGRLLNFVKSNFPDGKYRGTELTLSMRRVAWHEFGIRLDEDFVEGEYDLIVSYKVAEHIPNVDKEMRRYAENLSDDGYLYIGVPIWFKTMHCFGLSNWSFPDYYHPNHINMWTREHFQYLLKKCGLKVVKSDYVMYDDAYLCKRDDSLMDAEPPKLYEQVKEALVKIKTASDLYSERKFNDAFKIWPDFPDAHINYYEIARAQFHEEGFEKIAEYLNQALNCCPESSKVVTFVAGVLMRYDQYQKAVEMLDKGFRMRPNCPTMLEALGNCFRDCKDYEGARKHTKHLAMVSTQYRPQAVTMAFKDASMIPTPWEQE